MSYSKHTDLVGRQIRSVTWDDSDLVIEFYEDDDAKYRAYGDCCSYSWIEHITVPPDINGATVIGPWKESDYVADDDWLSEKNSYEYISVYHEALPTDRGEIIVEFRNSSNGYYGGTLEEVGY